MKRYIALVIALVLMIAVSLSFAQTPRSYGDSRDNGAYPRPSEGLSVFTSLATTGLDVDGVPGFIAMTSSSGKLFYLYIDDMNVLRIASPSQVATTASPNMTDWSNTGERIGGQ